MDKLVRDGKVAVVYSPGYGAGWSTWNTEHAEMLCMDREIAQAVLDGNTGAAVEIAKAKCPGIYDGGGESLVIAWVPQGKAFEVTEYDGAEGVRLIELGEFMVA